MAGYRLAEEEQRGGAMGSSVQLKTVGMRPRWKRQSPAAVPDAGNSRVKRSQWRRAVAKSTFRVYKGMVSHPLALKE